MPTRAERDACDVLDADHRAVKKLFKDYDALAGSAAKRVKTQRLDLAREICRQLTAHATIEEEIFYPAVRASVSEQDTLAEAEVEHSTAKNLIAQLEDATEADEAFDARVKVLSEYVDHHVKEERSAIFPKARAARRLDLVSMADELVARKEELLGQPA